jgi:hypothetical protein
MMAGAGKTRKFHGVEYHLYDWEMTDEGAYDEARYARKVLGYMVRTTKAAEGRHIWIRPR